MVQIIAGRYRSRRLETIQRDRTSRPMLSRVKESVFGMLQGWFEDARVLDLFAGVGTIGLEAASRGAAAVLCVEQNPRVYRVLQENVRRLGCGDVVRTLCADALGRTCLLAAPQPVDVVFMDPPYELMRQQHPRQRVLGQAARCRPIMAQRGFLVLRSPFGDGPAPLGVEGFEGPEVHRYRRDMWVLLYERRAGPAAGDVSA